MTIEGNVDEERHDDWGLIASGMQRRNSGSDVAAPPSLRSGREHVGVLGGGRCTNPVMKLKRAPTSRSQ